MPWLRAVLSRISYDVAAAQWLLFVPVNGQGEPTRNRILQRARTPERHKAVAAMLQAGELEEVVEHPLLDLLHNTNPVHTGLQTRRVTQVHLDSVGDSFWLMERSRLKGADGLGVPIAVYSIPPHWILATPTPSRPFYRLQANRFATDIPASEMIRFCDVDPFNPYGRGSGVARSLGDELETDEYAAKTIKALFANRARPDLIIWPKGDGDLKRDQVDKLEDHWVRHNRGFWRMFRPYFLRRAVEVKEIDTNLRTLQFTQIREFERDTVFQVFGVSPEMLGVIRSGSSRATIATSEHIYESKVLVPRLELIREVLQERLTISFDEKLVIDYVSPVKGDAEQELNAAKAAPWSLRTNEWRKLAGEEPLPEDEGGNVHMVPSNLTPVDSLGSEPPESPPGEGSASAERRPGLDRLEPRSVAHSPYESSVEVERVAVEFLAADDVDSAMKWASIVRQVDPDDPPATQLSDRLVLPYRNAQEEAWSELTADLDIVEAAIKANRPDEVLAAFGGIGAIREALASVMMDLGASYFLQGAELGVAALPPVPERQPIDITFDAVNPEATRWAEEEAAKLVTVAADDVTTQATIRALIAMGNEFGISPAKMAKMMVDDDLIVLLPRQVEASRKFRARLLEQGIAPDKVEARALRYERAQLRLRATMIARTETMASLNNGQQALWQLAKQRGVLAPNVMREWLVTFDERLEAECEALAGETVGLDEPFSSGDMVPPLHVMCRCSVGLVLGPVTT